MYSASSHPPTTTSAMGLCHRVATWGPAPQGASISSVHPETPGDCGIYCGGSESRIHPTIHLAGRFKLLLCGQEGWRFTSMHRLCQLNSQIKQQPYPLPLVPAALEELCGAQVFTKLDLRSAYNLVRIRAGDKWKTAFVTPTGHYEYRVMPYGLSISPSVFQTFMNKVFGSSSIDPELPFAVEIDASTTGVGAVLSQVASEPPHLHPCAFYSRKLSPAEQNYDVGNRELLAIKLALEEWRHWLEGSNHPFTIITDHKNLQYLREVRCLNPRQARWPLFFTCFNFKITYRPGSKNISADALSRQFSSDNPAEPEPIIPSNLIISPILWEQDDTIRQATLQEPAPPECPEGKIFVPRSQRLTLLGTAPQSPGSGHPGSQRSLLLLQTRYWWPGMRRDTIRKTQRPWSHIGVDLMTDLPSSEGNTCILAMVDRFSKMCKFFPLKGLPTALETAEHLFQQTERKIQELGRYLWAYCHEDQHSRSRLLPWAEYAQNSLRQDTTGLTPFQCILCYQPPLFPWTEEPSHVPAVGHWFRRAVRQHKRFADVRRRPVPAYQPGDQVWLSTHDLRLRQPCRKLSPRYIGLFKILRRINDVTFQLQLPPRYRIHPTFHVSLLKPFYPSATETLGAEAEPPPPEVLDQPSIYTVHEILDSRRRGGHMLSVLAS
ncbi:hypothetical protein M9458_053386, partial [Cirrhinus mrigala]